MNKYYKEREELEYADPDEEMPHRGIPAAMRPDLPLHEEVLRACHAKKFSAFKQKSRLTGLSKALAAFKAKAELTNEPQAYEELVETLLSIDSLQEPLPPIPPSWVKWRLGQARSNRWSIEGTINALFNIDGLLKHCQYILRSMGKSPAVVPEEDLGIRTLGEG